MLSIIKTSKNFGNLEELNSTNSPVSSDSAFQKNRSLYIPPPPSSLKCMFYDFIFLLEIVFTYDEKLKVTELQYLIIFSLNLLSLYFFLF